jgi:protein TonB
MATFRADLRRRYWRDAACAAGMAVVALAAGCQGSTEPTVAPIPATNPIALATPPPTYPLELACANRGGQVVLMLTVGTIGVPTEVHSEVSSRRKALDAAAVAAVQKWHFTPATAQGKPIAARIRVPVTFTPPVMRPDVCFQLDEQQRRSK